MSATITKGYSFGATELVTNTKLSNLVDNATITGIVNAEISSSAAFDLSKLTISQLVFWENVEVAWENAAIIYI